VTKNHQERKIDETFCVHICNVKKQKNRKNNDEDGVKQKKARLIIDNEKQDPFQFVFDCDLQDALVILTFLNKHETGSYLISNSFQIWGVQRVALSLATPLGESN